MNVIKSQDEYEAALARIRGLRNSPATVAETSELKQLLDAVDEWDRRSGGQGTGERDDLAVLSVQTSSTFALTMARQFPRTDWVSDLADLLGKDRDYVEWHLQHDLMPPEDLVTAASRLIGGVPPSKRIAAEQGADRSAKSEELPQRLHGDTAKPAISADKPSWFRSLLNICVSGTAVAVTTSAALAILARMEGRSAIQPVNSTSHWFWGEEAGRSRRIDASHTVLGFVTHHGASLFWACTYELLRRHPQKRPAFGDAVAVSALAALVDYGVVPKRFTPGWEKVVSPPAIGIAYAIMALTLSLTPRSRSRRQ